MKKAHSLLHWMVVIALVIGVSYSVFHFTKVEAVDTRIVGIISATFLPNEGDDGPEYTELVYNGRPHTSVDLTGWSLTDRGNVIFDLSGIMLENNVKVRICEAEAADDPNCDVYLSESDVYNNLAGALVINNAEGVPVAHINYGGEYEAAVVNKTFSASINYEAKVYSKKDKISVCVAQNKGELREQQLNIPRLTKDIDRVVAAGVDIIPPFYFETNKVSLGYHPGVNWPEQKAIWENGCVK